MDEIGLYLVFHQVALKSHFHLTLLFVIEVFLKLKNILGIFFFFLLSARNLTLLHWGEKSDSSQAKIEEMNKVKWVYLKTM